MDSIKLALSAVAAGTLLAAGCGGGEGGTTFPARDFDCAAGEAPPCATTEPVDPVSVNVPESMEDTTMTYVVGMISLPEATSDGRAAGFNLDGLNSGEGSTAADANCEQFAEDFVNVDESSHVGVDNALQGLVSTIEALLDAGDCPGGTTEGCLDATLQSQIAEGSLILLMEVSGINDYTYDPEVQLQLFLGEVDGGGAPMTSGSGGLAAGQTFNTMQALGDPVAGDIIAGRLRGSADLLTINIDVGDFALPLMISSAEIRFDIAVDGSTLNRGQIGGYLQVEDIVAAASMIMDGLEATVRSVVGNIADVEPSAEDPAVCDAVSVGLTFEAVGATRAP